MKIIGVTGGIGSGKSTVTKILSGFGAAIIDADIIAREIVGKGQKALVEITELFGREVLTEFGELNRKELGNIVFSDKNKLESLNGITHKYIIEKIIEKIDKICAGNDADFIVIDAAIPFKHGFVDTVDEVWVVIADTELKIKRVMDRSGLTYEQVMDRIKSQKKDEDYIDIAHRLIVNNGSVEELKSQIEKILFKVI